MAVASVYNHILYLFFHHFLPPPPPRSLSLLHFSLSTPLSVRFSLISFPLCSSQAQVLANLYKPFAWSFKLHVSCEHELKAKLLKSKGNVRACG